MILQHAAAIAKAHAIAAGGSPDLNIKDVVVTVPSFATELQRRSLQIAADMAGLNVLGLVDETVAAALQYAMDKDFSGGEQTILFYNMGASSTQVIICHFFNYDQPQKYGKPKSTPAFTVLAKAWDATLGGQSFDHRITEYLADQLNSKLKDVDVRTQPRTMTKLRLEANKIKHVLSANTERPVSLDDSGAHVSLTLTRSQVMEELCPDLVDAAVEPVKEAIRQWQELVNSTTTLTATQVLGGGMRIPAVQAKLAQVVASVSSEDGTAAVQHNMNSDESMALGAAFYGANVSTAFRVRSIGMTDVLPWPIGIGMENLEATDVATDDDGAWSKDATIFKAWGKVGVKKTIAFTHDQDVKAGLRYVESGQPLQQYNVTGIAEFAKEMEKIGKPKVSLQFELSSSGIASLVKAEAAVEETYIVEEEVEVDDEEEASDENVTASEDKESAEEETGESTESNETSTEDEGGNETTTEGKNETTEEPAKKKKKTIKVEKVR